MKRITQSLKRLPVHPRLLGCPVPAHAVERVGKRDQPAGHAAIRLQPMGRRNSSPGTSPRYRQRRAHPRLPFTLTAKGNRVLAQNYKPGTARCPGTTGARRSIVRVGGKAARTRHLRPGDPEFGRVRRPPLPERVGTLAAAVLGEERGALVYAIIEGIKRKSIPAAAGKLVHERLLPAGRPIRLELPAIQTAEDMVAGAGSAEALTQSASVPTSISTPSRA